MLEVILEFILFSKKKEGSLFTSLIYFCLLEIIYCRGNNKSTEGKKKLLKNLILFHRVAREREITGIIPFFSSKRCFLQSLQNEQITNKEF